MVQVALQSLSRSLATWVRELGARVWHIAEKQYNGK